MVVPEGEGSLAVDGFIVTANEQDQTTRLVLGLVIVAGLVAAGVAIALAPRQ